MINYEFQLIDIDAIVERENFTLIHRCMYLFVCRLVVNQLNFTPSELEKHWGKMYPHLQGYDISKLALVLHAKELAKQLAGKSRPGV